MATRTTTIMAVSWYTMFNVGDKLNADVSNDDTFYISKDLDVVQTSLMAGHTESL